MTPTSPPHLARQRPLPDPYNANELPPFSLPSASLTIESNGAPATPNITVRHGATSQPGIGEMAPHSESRHAPENSGTPLDTTPTTSQQLDPKPSTIPRPGTLSDPAVNAAMSPLQLPVSQASVRPPSTSKAGGTIHPSGISEPLTPPHEE